MTRILDLDLGWRPPIIVPQDGLDVSSAPMPPAGIGVWVAAPTVTKLDVALRVIAWQAIGGQAATTIEALRLFRQQLRELIRNPDLQPIYIRWFETSQPGLPSRSDQDDGWYYLEALGFDPESYVGAGTMEMRVSAIPVGTLREPLAIGYSGTALSSGFSATPVPLVAAPKGATLPLTSTTRAGAEGSIPICYPGTTGPNPVPFAASATISDLWKCGCRVWDTVTAGGNAPPTDGTAANSAWVEVKGPDHAFQGDVVVTNGLLLLQFVFGSSGLPTIWLWNTSLGTAAWQNVAAVQYKDGSFNAGTLAHLSLDRVGLQVVRLTLRANTSAGHWAQLVWQLKAGRRDASVEFWPETQSNSTGYGLDMSFQQSVLAVFNDSGVVDVAKNPSTNLAATSSYGYGAALGTSTNQGVMGWLYQGLGAAPSAQPAAGSTNDIGFGDSATPAIGTYKLYGIFALPWVAAASHQAEAESGTLGTGWSSVSDGGVQAAKCASGTGSTNADLWGTAFQPTAGVYDLWVRLRVASTASSTSQMQIGLWNSTDSVFVASTTYAPNAAGLSTSYVWVRVAAAVTPTASKNMRVRAVTTATTTTDWFIDESLLAPVRQGSPAGVGEFPADIYAQFAYDAEAALVIG